MDAEQFLELQKQMRQNNEEISDFLKDLGSWKSDIERKDAQLRNEVKQDDNLPAVRNSLFKKHRKKSRPVQQQSNGKQTKRISGHDYRAWDKFDVDKALAELDDNAEVTNSSRGEEETSSETDEEMENNRRIALAKEARDLGNLRFKEGKFLEAVEHYTSSVRLTPEDPIPLTNRALANLKLERYASAEADCSAALVLDCNCVKALFRRALARKHLDKLSDAVVDLQSVLRLDPSNKTARNELLQLTGSSPELPKASADGDSVIRTDTSRKFRRIPIVEVGETKERAPTATHTTTSTRTATPTPIVSLNPDGPSNWFQLERELRELSNAKQSITNYLCSIAPHRYAEVIGNNLDTAFLVKMFHALSACELSRDEILCRLDKLSALPRFDVAWMMVDDSDRQVAMDVLTRIGANSVVRERFS